MRDRDMLRRRDAVIVRLNAAGWSLRQIGRDPRVRLSPEGVRQILRRLDADDKGWELDPLLLWRDARTGLDARASEVWALFTARVDEVAQRIAEDHLGSRLENLDPMAQQSVRAEASGQVSIALYDELAAAR